MWRIERRNGAYCILNSDDVVVSGHPTLLAALDELHTLYSDADVEDETSALVEAVRQLVNKLEGTQEASPVQVPAEASAEVAEANEQVEVAEHFAWEGVITVEGLETGDGRLFKAGAVTWKDELLPFPFTWQRESQPGHDGNVTIGRVDSIFRAENGDIRGKGIILGGSKAPPEAGQYRDLLETGAAGWVSIDGDSAEFDIIENSDDPWDYKMEFTSINIRSLCAVSISAFETAKIQLSGEMVVASITASDLNTVVVVEEDGSEYIRTIDDRENEPLLASVVPVNPPAEWFGFKATELTPLTITDDGQVFGHLCGKETCHIGFGSCKTSPRNCDYDNYFHLGVLKTAEGDIVNVGHMTFSEGHADITLSAQAAAAVYDSTSRVSADIRCGEDEFGTWVAGALRPGLSEEDIREVRSAPLSGDWRPIKGKLQLIAAHAVNVPGFPISRAKVLVASGVTEAIIITEDCGCDLSAEYSEMLFELDIEEMES